MERNWKTVLFVFFFFFLNLPPRLNSCSYTRAVESICQPCDVQNHAKLSTGNSGFMGLYHDAGFNPDEPEVLPWMSLLILFLGTFTIFTFFCPLVSCLLDIFLFFAHLSLCFAFISSCHLFCCDFVFHWFILVGLLCYNSVNVHRFWQPL